MEANTVKELIASGRTAYGTFVYSPDPAVVELIGAAGFDFVIVDMEHASLDRRDVENLIRAAGARGISAFVRVNAPEAVTSSLDAGAAGIVAPHFGADRASRELASSVQYHPIGTRGACTCSRAVDYGLFDFADYVAGAARDVWLVAQIEDPEAVDAIEEILAASGVDAVLPGRSDLAAGYGVAGNLSDPRVVAAVERVTESARRLDVVSAMYVSTPDEGRHWEEKGAQMVVCSIDYKILALAYADLLRGLRISLEPAG